MPNQSNCCSNDVLTMKLDLATCSGFRLADTLAKKCEANHADDPLCGENQ